MPWCPNCKTAYPDGIDKCTDCWEQLVESLEHEKTSEEAIDREVFLTSAGSNAEADMLEGLLNSNEIPVMRKYREAGGYMNIYMGNTVYGIDLFVPTKLLDKAKEIIEVNKLPIEPVEEMSAQDDDLTTLQNSYDKKRRTYVWIILLLFIPGIIWLLFAGVNIIINVLSK